MLKVLTLVGARPQFVKAAVVSRAIDRVDGITEVLVHSGQHYDHQMSDVFFQELGVPTPRYNLGVGSGSHSVQTAEILKSFEPVVEQEQPDWIVVFGDTNTTLAGALVAAKEHVRLAHVEAGLRSFNRTMPEEINRIVTDSISDLLLCPSTVAVANLQAEGVAASRIHNVGDVMYDVALRFAEGSAAPDLARTYGITGSDFVLATVHRAENTDDLTRLHAIFEGLIQVAKSVPVVAPLHPRTIAALDAAGTLPRVRDALMVIEPVGYLEMLALERAASVVVTDSGGVQKEAYFHRTPCVTVRTETEWVELVESGWNRLVDPHCSQAIAEHVLAAIGTTGAAEQLYGDGHSAEKIVEVLLA